MPSMTARPYVGSGCFGAASRASIAATAWFPAVRCIAMIRAACEIGAATRSPRRPGGSRARPRGFASSLLKLPAPPARVERNQGPPRKSGGPSRLSASERRADNRPSMGNTEEMARAAALPQADASSLVDAGELEAKVREMYGHVAREEEADLHFEVGRDLAEHLGYPAELLDAIPAEALRVVRGRRLPPRPRGASPRARRCSISARAPGPTCSAAAVQVGRAGRAVGVDFTREQVAKAHACATATGSPRRASSRRGSTSSRSTTGRSTP